MSYPSRRGPNYKSSQGRSMRQNPMGNPDPLTDKVYAQMQNAYKDDKKRKIDVLEEEAINGVIKRIKLKESDTQLKNYIYTALLTNHYTPSDEKKNYILKTARSRIPKPLTQEQQFQQDFSKKQAAWRAQQEDAENYESDDYCDDDTDWAAEEAADKKREEKEEEEFQKYLKECEDKKTCDKKKMEIKQLHLNEGGLKNDEIDTKRRKNLRDRLVNCNNKKKVSHVDQQKMTKEEAQKVIPTLEMGDDIEEFKEGQDTKYKVIKKSDTTELNHDWRLMWNIHQEFSRIKYYNPTFKLEIFDKPTKGKPQYDNEHIRNNLKNAYENKNDENKIIVWNPVREQGMVDIYDPTKDLDEPKKDMRMGWDDTNKDNERPYYIYKQNYKDIVTYEPPMHLLSSASFKGIHGVYTNEKEAGLKQPGGKRKTRKQKKTKKTKKAGKKTTQKKRKQRKQKRGTRGKK